jgi:hypothetical protein
VSLSMLLWLLAASMGMAVFTALKSAFVLGSLLPLAFAAFFALLAYGLAKWAIGFWPRDES